MSNKIEKLTAGLVTPTCKKEFTNANGKEWARRIIVDYMKKSDPDWLLASVLKVLDVVVKDNTSPGMLSNSYNVDVTYTDKFRNGEMIVESWFVKVPLSQKTFLLDEMEVFMYDKMIPMLQAFAAKACINENDVVIPIALIYHAAFEEDNPKVNVLVMENLKDQGYKPLRPETCGLVYMRAAMTSLAVIHATGLAYQTALGGRLSFLTRFPLIKEENMPKAKKIKDNLEDMIEPYLEYMGKVAPDIAPQIAFLKKFHKFLLGIFHNLQKDKDMWYLMGMVHGDSKIDNFMFKKNPWSPVEEYKALIIDWQGVAYDLLSGDLLWTLYGFSKNLPDKNATVESWMDYSIHFYHQELLRYLNLMHVDMSKLNLPEHEHDAKTLIRKGFLYDFMKTVLFKPLLTMIGREKVKKWFQNQDTVPLPDEKEVFKSGTSFVNYIHLQITIATEVGVFHDLAPLCIQSMKDSLFGITQLIDDSDEEEETTENPEEEHLGNEAIEDVLSQAAAILGDQDAGYDGPGLASKPAARKKTIIEVNRGIKEPKSSKENDLERKVSITETVDSDGETVKGMIVIQNSNAVDSNGDKSETNEEKISDSTKANKTRPSLKEFLEAQKRKTEETNRDTTEKLSKESVDKSEELSKESVNKNKELSKESVYKSEDLSIAKGVDESAVPNGPSEKLSNGDIAHKLGPNETSIESVSTDKNLETGLSNRTESHDNGDLSTEIVDTNGAEGLSKPVLSEQAEPESGSIKKSIEEILVVKKTIPPVPKMAPPKLPTSARHETIWDLLPKKPSGEEQNLPENTTKSKKRKKVKKAKKKEVVEE